MSYSDFLKEYSQSGFPNPEAYTSYLILQALLRIEAKVGEISAKLGATANAGSTDIDFEALANEMSTNMFQNLTH